MSSRLSNRGRGRGRGVPLAPLQETIDDVTESGPSTSQKQVSRVKSMPYGSATIIGNAIFAITSAEYWYVQGMVAHVNANVGLGHTFSMLKGFYLNCHKPVTNADASKYKPKDIKRKIIDMHRLVYEKADILTDPDVPDTLNVDNDEDDIFSYTARKIRQDLERRSSDRTPPEDLVPDLFRFPLKVSWSSVFVSVKCAI